MSICERCGSEDQCSLHATTGEMCCLQCHERMERATPSRRQDEHRVHISSPARYGQTFKFFICTRGVVKTFSYPALRTAAAAYNLVRSRMRQRGYEIFA